MRRLKCDFSATGGARPEPVAIRQTLSYRASRTHLQSRIAARAKRAIGARRAVPSVPTRIRSSSNSELFLLYLTGRVIFDNRHGLLKKLASARAAETLVCRGATT